MFEYLYPDLYCESIFDIPYNKLLSLKRNFLIFDLDNTLAPFNVTFPPEEVIRHIQQLKNSGFSICILSNNKPERVEAFNRPLGLYYIAKAKKPGKSGVMRALSLMNGSPEKAVMIGDQIFTDVWCGNRCKLYSILVKPVSPRDEWSVKLKRGPEKIVINRYLKKNRKI